MKKIKELKFTIIAKPILALIAGYSSNIFAGDEVRNGGDSIRIVFEEGRQKAINKASMVKNNLENFPRASREDNWIHSNIDSLVKELTGSNFIWSQNLPEGCMQDACACTAQKPLAEIYLSYRSCQIRYVNTDYAAKLVIHEATHHLGIKDENFADSIAIRVHRFEKERGLLNYVDGFIKGESLSASHYDGGRKWLVNLNYKLREDPSNQHFGKIRGAGIGFGYYLLESYSLGMEMYEISSLESKKDAYSPNVYYQGTLRHMIQFSFLKYFFAGLWQGISQYYNVKNNPHLESVTEFSVGLGTGLVLANGLQFQYEKGYVASSNDERLRSGVSLTSVIDSFYLASNQFSIGFRF